MITGGTSVPVEESSQIEFLRFWDRLYYHCKLSFEQIEALLPQQQTYWINMVEREPAIERGELPVMWFNRNKMLEFFKKWVELRKSNES